MRENDQTPFVPSTGTTAFLPNGPRAESARAPSAARIVRTACGALRMSERAARHSVGAGRRPRFYVAFTAPGTDLRRGIARDPAGHEPRPRRVPVVHAR